MIEFIIKMLFCIIGTPIVFYVLTNNKYSRFTELAHKVETDPNFKPTDEWTILCVKMEKEWKSN